MKGVKFCALSGCGAKNIDASLFVLNIDGDNLLLDAGYMEGMRLPAVLSRLEDIDAPFCILVTHAHLDHLGLIPCLHMLYPYAQIIMTAPTIAFAPTILNDAQGLSPDLHDAIHDLSGFSKAGSERAILDTLSSARTTQIAFGETRLAGKVRITAFKAGHIPGAASFLIEGREGTRVFYTGDFSTVSFLTVDAPNDLLRTHKPLDVLICESTYGDRKGSNREEEVKDFIEKINTVLTQGGRVLVPSFALGRAQEILAILRKSMQNGELKVEPKILLAGMAKRITSTYDSLDDRFKPNFLKENIGSLNSSDSVILVPDNKAHDVALSQNAPCIFVATSGKLKGGPSEGIAQEIIREENSAILFVGFLDEESPGRKLLQKKKGDFIKLHSINGKASKVRVRCDILQYRLSAHSNSEELTRFISDNDAKCTILVHGSLDARKALSVNPLNLSKTKILIPKNGQRFTIVNDPASEESLITLDLSGEETNEEVTKKQPSKKEKEKKESRKMRTVKEEPKGTCMSYLRFSFGRSIDFSKGTRFSNKVFKILANKRY